MDNYFLNYEEIKDLTVGELSIKLSRMEGIKLKDMRLENFIFFNSSAIKSGRGVYIFKDGQNAYYIGDCTSRSFIERIPSHFDTKCEAWMNMVVKHYAKRTLNLPLTDENLEFSASYILNNFSLILINFENYDKVKISNLERLLLSTLDPINKLGKPIKFELHEKVYIYS